jgi:hypothetical protein
MNKTALKNFATNARRELIKKVEAKALKIGITEENIKKAQIESSDAIYIDGKQLTITEKKQRDKLIQRIKDIGFKQVVEEVAYTWFNRFIALRFMEVNNYLPTKVRVLSSSNPDNPEPDILKEALSVDLDIDKNLVYELKINNKTEELYKYLIIKQCNSLNKYLPFLFETIEDYKEILFPEGLLSKDSFLREITDTKKIPESNWEKVEIIGWLYQYYIAEEKDRVIKAKKKYKKEEIPFATQLFTPDWIVRYMVQNTLGRYWVESHPEHRDLIKNWEFYLENPNPELDFEEKLAPYINRELKVEDIKCFDPAMGSGHILVYMFDLLYEIYSRCGYMEREIPRLIIENNLYGLEIDDRAYQLACFSIVMKALEYNPRFFRSIEREGLTLNLASIQETNSLNDDDIVYIAGENCGEKFNRTKDFIEQFKNAKTLGSLIKVGNYNTEFFEKRLQYIQNTFDYDLFVEESKRKSIILLPDLIKQANIMSMNFDIIVTNPPYMGSRYMNDLLTEYIRVNYPETKADTFSAFIECCLQKATKNGHLGFLSPFVWMFISEYEKLRKIILNKTTISSLIQLEYNAFPEACVPVCTFTLRNYIIGLAGQYIKLSDFTGSEKQPIMTLEAIKNPEIGYRYTAYSANFNKIPGEPIAYWVSERIIEAFEKGISIDQISDFTGSQNITANNIKFLRKWWEVESNKIGQNKRWVFYAKGGSYRKHYGNLEFIVDWGDDARNYYKNNKTSNLLDEKYWYKEGITYTDITTTRGSTFRYLPPGCVFDKTGPTICNVDHMWYVLALLNSKIMNYYLQFLNPTMHIQVKDVKNLPIILDETKMKNIEATELENVNITKMEWDSYEVSWEFKEHPLLTFKNGSLYIKDSFNCWSRFVKDMYFKLKNNEEELNKLFIDIYNLQNEISPNVEEEDVTVKNIDREKGMKSFISYAVGCMFGRYSLDEKGLVFAGGQFDLEKYITFSVDKDNILPILSEAYFEDDIATRFVEFVKVTFGEETLEENIEFIADTLGKRNGETARDTIRRYFLNDFYKDHVQTYKKRPIYWLFTSGKQKAFNCLIYMHRYDKTTLSRIRTDYLHPLQIRLDAERKSLLEVIEGGGTAKEISNAKKELKQLDLKIEELKAYDELLHHMADMQIEIDLDDGVAVNYAKFNGLLAKLD